MGVNVLVVGGGVVGLTVAHHLAAARLTVEVLDQGEPGRGASWAGAGILPPGYPAFADTPVDKLRAVTTRMFPAYSERLLSDTGVDNGYLRSGGVEFLAANEHNYYLGRWGSERLDVRPLDAAGLDALAPGCVPPTRTSAFHLPEFAQVRNPWHLRALLAGCRQWRAKVISPARVTGFELANGRVDGVKLSTGEVRRADRYVVAAGAWAAPLFAQLGADVPVAPVRGQIVLFAPPRPVCGPVLLVGPRYLVPRADGKVLAGSTEEPEAGFDANTTPEGIAELTAFAHDLLPPLRDVPVEAAWAGLRPGSPDHRPTIGPVPGHPDVISAVGHFRAGVQLSLGTAYLVRNFVLGEPPILPTEPFAVGRNVREPVRTAFRS